MPSRVPRRYVPRRAGGNDTFTRLLLHCDGADAATSFPDASASAHTITANGNAQVDTAQSKFGGASALLDGSGDYLEAPTSVDFSFGTGDFTVDLWGRLGSTSGYQPFINLGVGASGVGTILNTAWGVFYQGGNLLFYRYSHPTETVVSRAWSPSTNIWYHIAVARAGTTMKMFIDGSQIGTDISSSVDYSSVNSDPLRIGYWRSGASGGTHNYLTGHLDEIRISKGIARNTADVTPRTVPYF